MAIKEVDEKGKDIWSAAEVADTTKVVIYNSETKEQYTVETSIAHILNTLEDIKKSVVG